MVLDGKNMKPEKFAKRFFEIKLGKEAEEVIAEARERTAASLFRDWEAVGTSCRRQ